MPEITNNTVIDIEDSIDDKDRPSAIKVDHVSMTFNMASEQLNNLKEYFLAIVKHNLFFEELKALDDISFDVKQGDVFGIVGTNGSGKSTMLKIIAGVLDPTEGSVTINGSIAPLIELGAGFDMELSARENIYLNGALLGYSKDFIDQHFDDIVEFSEVEKFLDMPMKNYSSGMVARIAFAISTVIAPEILIVDEVLSVGDFMFQKKCEDKILDLIKNHNTTVLIVSHSNAQIERLCNKVIWIEKGKTRMLDTSKKVCEIYGLVGGRTGSQESENEILKIAAKSPSEDDISAAQFFLRGNSYSETCLALAKHAGVGVFKNVVLSCRSTHLNVICANALAGALNAPVLSISEADVDYHLIDWLEEKQPENIYIFNACNFDGPYKLQKHDFSWSPNVHMIDGLGDGFSLSFELFAKMKELADVKDEVILAQFETIPPEVLKTAPFAFSNHIATLFVDENNREKAHSNMQRLKDAGITKVYCTGEEVEERYVPILNELGVETQIIKSEDLSKFGISTFADVKEAIVMPSHVPEYADAASAGFYGATKGAAVVVVDDTSLDSIVSACKFIQENDIKKLSFVCGPGELSKSTMDLLTKTAALNA